MDERAQRALARIRTDLDSFSDIEAHSLMVDGYLMTDLTMFQQTRLHDFVSQVPTAPIGDVPERWSFRLAAPLIAPGAAAWYLERLGVGKERFLKPALVYAPKAVWNGLVALLLVVLLVLVVLSGWLDGSWPIVWVLGVAVGVLVFGVVYVLEIPPPTTPVAGPVFVGVRFLISLALVPLAVVFTTLFGLVTWLSGRLHVRLGRLPR